MDIKWVNWRWSSRRERQGFSKREKRPKPTWERESYCRHYKLRLRNCWRVRRRETCKIARPLIHIWSRGLYPTWKGKQSHDMVLSCSIKWPRPHFRKDLTGRNTGDTTENWRTMTKPNMRWKESIIWFKFQIKKVDLKWNNDNQIWSSEVEKENTREFV